MVTMIVLWRRTIILHCQAGKRIVSSEKGDVPHGEFSCPNAPIRRVAISLSASPVGTISSSSVQANTIVFFAIGSLEWFESKNTVSTISAVGRVLGCRVMMGGFPLWDSTRP